MPSSVILFSFNVTEHPNQRTKPEYLLDTYYVCQLKRKHFGCSLKWSACTGNIYQRILLEC